METTAIIRGVHISAQKTRLVADLIRGKSVVQALNIPHLLAQEGRRHPEEACRVGYRQRRAQRRADIDELKVPPFLWTRLNR